MKRLDPAQEATEITELKSTSQFRKYPKTFNRKESNINQQGMSVLALIAMVVLAMGLPACSTAPVSQATKEEQRTDMRDMANETLRLWYAGHPGAKQSVKQSAGCAVFSDGGYKVLMMGGAKGGGGRGEQLRQAGVLREEVRTAARSGLGRRNISRDLPVR